MIKLKIAGVVAGLYAAGVVGGGYLTIGCGATEDGDGSPTPDTTSPTPTESEPVPLYMEATSDYVAVECTGTTSDTTFSYYMYNKGQATDESGLEPIVYVYDNVDWGYNGDFDAVYAEAFTLALDADYPDGSGTIVAQDWSREGLDWVDATSNTEDTNTIFQCENIDFLTYVFCAYDIIDYTEVCVGVGKDPSDQCPDCFDVSN